MPIITFVDHTIPVAADFNDSYSFINTEVRTYERGGTGLSSYTKGDILYASATNTVAKLAIGVYGAVLGVSSSGVPGYGRLIYKSGTDVPGGGGASTSLLTAAPTLAANALGTNNMIRATVQALVTNNTGSAGAFTWVLKYGATSRNLASESIPNGTTNGLYNFRAYLMADNSTSAQLGFVVADVLNTARKVYAPSTYAEDSTGALTYDLLANTVASATYTVTYAMIEYLA